MLVRKKLVVFDFYLKLSTIATAFVSLASLVLLADHLNGLLTYCLQSVGLIKKWAYDLVKVTSVDLSYMHLLLMLFKQLHPWW